MAPTRGRIDAPVTSPATIRDATERDLPAIVAIYNDAVRHSTAIWSSVDTDVEDRRAWWQLRRSAGFPVLVAEVGLQPLAYASFAPFRPFDGYRYTMEHSVYVAANHRRQGLGSLLLEELVHRAKALGTHMMVAGIDATNTESLRLHARLGFTEVARMPEVGRKFDRWLDLVFLQRRL